MALPATPDPCPDLQEGLALGAPEHAGFVAAWNWIVGIFRKAKDFFVFGVNGRTGEIEIVAGDGINVLTSGKTITISIGDGEDEDDGDMGDGDGGGGGDGSSGSSGDGSGGGGGSGGSGSGGSGSGSSGGSGSGEGYGEGDGGGCNGWSDDDDVNGNGDAFGNQGDDCNVVNGW